MVLCEGRRQVRASDGDTQVFDKSRIVRLRAFTSPDAIPTRSCSPYPELEHQRARTSLPRASPPHRLTGWTEQDLILGVPAPARQALEQRRPTQSGNKCGRDLTVGDGPFACVRRCGDFFARARFVFGGVCQRDSHRCRFDGGTLYLGRWGVRWFGCLRSGSPGLVPTRTPRRSDWRLPRAWFGFRRWFPARQVGSPDETQVPYEERYRIGELLPRKMPAHDPLAALLVVGLAESVLNDHAVVVRLDELGSRPTRRWTSGDVELVHIVAYQFAATSLALSLEPISRHDHTGSEQRLLAFVFFRL